MKNNYLSKITELPPPHFSEALRFSWTRRFTVLLIFALALLFSGCDVLKSLGLLPNDDPEPAPHVWGVPVQGAEEKLSIKEKFGVTEPGTAGVDAAFRELSAFIKGGGLEEDLKKDLNKRVIKTGDWIDLEDGLIVANYVNLGGVNHAGTAQAFDGTPLLRLIVVGINSFQSKEGAETYTYPAGDETPPPHVVFQFQNIPAQRRLDSAMGTNGGYPAKELSAYVNVNFLKGLTDAGVPDSVLWGPKRVLSKGQNNGADVVSHKLWVPTEREMMGTATYSSSGETAVNQARLEYYQTALSRIKYTGTSALRYWESTASGSNGARFCYVENNGSTGHFDGNVDSGVSPAFCVVAEQLP
ncbi:MAG: hypothetical protein LBL31_00515 [Spirochaetaceae bacterium]|jgi:hypothetical protein|nr:hypothetical protein [Spirochaetaceae bacterium]